MRNQSDKDNGAKQCVRSASVSVLRVAMVSWRSHPARCFIGRCVLHVSLRQCHAANGSVGVHLDRALPERASLRAADAFRHCLELRPIDALRVTSLVKFLHNVVSL